jgi:hypothetical protein
LLHRQQQHGDEKQAPVRRYVSPQTPDQSQIVGLTENFFLVGELGHLDLLQLLGQALLLVEFGIEAATLHQLMVATSFENATVLKNEDFIRILYSGNPMGNDQTRFLFQYRPQSLQNLSFGLGINTR